MRPAYLKPAVDLAADKPHGLRIKYLGGCRCHDCRRANADYERNQYALRRTGEGNGLVDADPARRHLETLSRSRIGTRSVAHISGVGQSIISMIKNGKRRQIRLQTEARILKITAPKKVRKQKPRPATMRVHA